jgi:hypothetical protein
LVLTYFTPWNRVLLEKLTSFAASQEIPRIYYWYYASQLNSAAIVNKEGEIIINPIKIIKIIYKFHYKINAVAEPPEVAHGILGFPGIQFENRWKSDTEENKLRSTWHAKRTP